MPSIVFLVDKQIEASMTRLFTLNDIDGTPLAGIDWAGDDIYSPCITILRDGVSINYDGVILNNRVTQQDGTLTIAPPPKWYSRQGNIPSSEWKNRKKGDRFYFATCDNPTGDLSYCADYRNLYTDNASIRLSNLNVWNDATMTGSCMDMRIGMNYSSTGMRVLVAQAGIDTLNPFGDVSTPKNPAMPATRATTRTYENNFIMTHVIPCTS